VGDVTGEDTWQGLKGTSLVSWSGGEQMVGGGNDTKGDTIGMGPYVNTPPFWTPPFN
jgi:hypothetical protein